ncbi:MAG TPA: molecular chaperone HtpG [Dongiaceae bacterium]|nr:molecular chaperone HtpG [Dongiaceae bacterium]
MQMERHGFQAEVSRLLDIVAHSLYSDKSVFLRELVSNASDACDKLRYLALTEPGLIKEDPEFKVTINIDKEKRQLTVADNGIGMNHDDLIANLGTIARSGSAKFMEELAASKANGGGETGDGDKNVSLIGQFGVGFYAAFMVADKVEVVSRKAGEDQAWRWISDGKGEFTVEPAEKAGRGSDIILHLRADAGDYLDAAKLTTIISKYSDHIQLPIHLTGDGEPRKINQGAALWTRSKSEITAEQYRDFYRHVAHAFDEPWATLHFKAEGKIDYTGLLFIPSTKPFDLFNPDRKQALKLYVKRVFITDHCEEVLPHWLRFVKGLVDSEDLPLNISREMLQQNPILTLIRGGLVKRVLAELGKKAENDAEAYRSFWENFGAVLKEGIYEEADHREALLKLARFRSTKSGTENELVSLADYIGRMQEGQDAIYYITGDSLDAVAKSAQLEGYKAKGVEVLLLTDPIDEFWIPAVEKFDGKEFKSVTRGGADLDKVKASADAKPEEKKPAAEGIDNLVALMKLTLKESVKDVRLSSRLTDSAVCLVADAGDMDMRLARLLKQHRQLDATLPRVLEINGSHPLIAALAKAVSSGAKKDAVGDASWVLLDQAKLQEGETLSDPAAFGQRLSSLLQQVF